MQGTSTARPELKIGLAWPRNVTARLRRTHAAGLNHAAAGYSAATCIAGA